MPTNIFSLDPGDTSTLPATDSSNFPSWLVGADNHNLGNTGGGSWFSPDTWSEKFSNAGKFISTSILSGANSFYNTGVTVGNWFGTNAEIRETDTWISSLDQDLGAYYSENRQAADLAGFIAGSLVPGLAGVKILNAGQKALQASKIGAVGGNMSRVTGILAPTTENYVKLAAADLAKTNASFSFLNANVSAALRNGVWQNVLEGAAFETAVQATMFKSPILDQQDLGDIVKNIAVGGAVSGVIGGAFSAARTYSQIKRAVGAEDIAAKPFTSREIAADALPPSSKIILMADERARMAIPDPLAATAGKDSTNFAQTQGRINNALREEVHAMTTAGDKEIGNLIADTLHVDAKKVLAGEAAADVTPVIQNFLHAEEVSRLGRITKAETDIKNALKNNDLETLDSLAVRVVKLNGEDAGAITVGTPKVVSIADQVIPKAGQSTTDAVMAKVKEFGFSAKKLWNPLVLSGKEAHIEAEARYIWWKNYDLNQLPKDFQVHLNDIPALERLFQDDAYRGVKFVDDAGRQYEIRSSQEMYDHIKDVKDEIANQYLLKRAEATKGIDLANEGLTEQIARIVNVKRSYLEGTRNIESEYSDLFRRQTLDKQYAARLLDEGLVSKPGEIRTEFIPEYAKITYRTPADLREMNGNVVDAIGYLRGQEKLTQEAVDNAVSKAAGDLAAQLPSADELTRLLPEANRLGAGPGLFSFASGAYGSLESLVQQIGSVTQRLKIARKEAAKDLLNAPLVRLSQDQAAAIEYANLHRIVASTSEHYVYVDELAVYGYGDGPGLLARKLLGDAEEMGFEKAGEKILQPGAPEVIPIRSQVAAEAAAAHVQTNGRRLIAEREMRAAQGKENYKDANTFYPVRPNTADYKYFAFVVDPRVTDVGHKSMIHAASERELNELVKQVQLKAPEYRVITKTEAEEFYRAKGEYEFDRTLHENYVDSDLRKRGIASEFFIKTDPQKIADDTLNYHMRQEDILATELVRAKYQKQFDWLEDQGKQYSFLEASRYGSTLERVEKYEKNPYMSYVKTALDVKAVSEYPLLSNINRTLDEATSRVFSHVREIWNGARAPADLDSINSALIQSGYNNAYYDAALNLYANHTAPKGELTKFVRTANAILSRFTLGLDPLNALNNAVGANVLRGTELASLTRAIQRADPEVAGKLAELTKLDIGVTAPGKLIANSFKTFFSDEGKALRESYKANGWIRDITEQFHSILDDFTLTGTESVTNMESRLNRAFAKAKELGDKGEKLTGNTLAEEFNRFVSADVMRQITDLGRQAGVLSEREAKAYINTFVNRVEGNIIASQRPMIFQGPIGQAVGLFQSYQFNLMQNLFRYVGEGRAKDVATLLGLQGTFYGLNGMPGFAFMNQHIVGTASGNTQHKDLYDATYGIAGKTAGELLLYGIPSFGLQANLYTRGDINPRQVTILPTTLADVPIVGAYTKFASSILDTAAKIGAGGSVTQSALFGLEHNGISRPLAGVAQVLRGVVQDGSVYSTSNKATILGQNDLLSWGSAVRLAGGKPMDQAIVSDAVYRIRAYEAVDRARKQNLSEAVRLSVQHGETASEDQIAEFASRYAASGGKQGQFAAWMMEQYKKANVTQSAEILKQVQNPLTQKVQILMGGEPMD